MFKNRNVPSLCFGPLLPLYCLRWESTRGGIASQISLLLLLSSSLQDLCGSVLDFWLRCPVEAVTAACRANPRIRKASAVLSEAWFASIFWASSFRSTRWNMWVDSTELCWGRTFALCNTIANWMQLRWGQRYSPWIFKECCTHLTRHHIIITCNITIDVLLNRRHPWWPCKSSHLLVSFNFSSPVNHNLPLGSARFALWRLPSNCRLAMALRSKHWRAHSKQQFVSRQVGCWMASRIWATILEK